jgi:hypothetical protein
LLGVCCYSCWPVFLFTAHVGGGSSPLSCGVFLPLTLSQTFLLLVAGHVPQSRWSPSGQAGLFIYSPGKDSPPHTSGLRVPHPLCHVSLLFLLLITQFLFFHQVGGRSVQGLYADLVQGCLWKYHAPFSSPCPHLPKPSGRGLLVAWGPSWFLHLTWSGDALHRLEVWRGQSFASSQWPCLPGVPPAFFQDFTVEGMLSASSL